MDAIAVCIQVTVQQQRAYDKARGKMPLGDWIKAAADAAAKRLPRSFCAYCGESVVLCKDGTARFHRLRSVGEIMRKNDPYFRDPACPGSYCGMVDDPDRSTLGGQGSREVEP